MGGVPVFIGSGVPLRWLFGELIYNDATLDEFIRDYPGTDRNQAVRVLELVGILLGTMVYENAATETADAESPEGHWDARRRARPGREDVTTQLHEAAWRGHTETVSALIAAAGADPNSYAIRGQGGTALHKAAWQGHADTVQALLVTADLKMTL